MSFHCLSAEALRAKADAEKTLGEDWHKPRVLNTLGRTTLALIMTELDSAICAIEQAGDAEFYALIGLFLRELDPQFQDFYRFTGQRANRGGAKAILLAMELLTNVSSYDQQMAQSWYVVASILAPDAKWVKPAEVKHQQRERCFGAARALFTLYYAWERPSLTAVHSYFSAHHPLVAETRATFVGECHAKQQPPPLALPVVTIG